MTPSPYRPVPDDRAPVVTIARELLKPRSKAETYLARFAPLGVAIAVLYGGIALGMPLTGFGVFLIVYVPLLLMMLARRRSTYRLIRENDDIAALANGGDLDGAERALAHALPQSRSLPLVHSLLAFNFGVVRLKRGDVAGARGAFDEVERAGWLADKRFQFHAAVENNLAFCDILDGNLEAADRRQRRAHEVCSPARSGQLVCVDAMLLLRRGKFDEAVGLLTSRWSAAESLSGAAGVKSLRLLRAFALERAALAHGDGAIDAATEREVGQLLDGARPFRPGEFDHLAIGWEAFGRFLEERGFRRSAAMGEG